MGRADFLQGMKDAAQGKPIMDKWERRTKAGVTSEQWSYERGRLFYFWLVGKGMHGDTIKDGRIVLFWAQQEYADAVRSGAII